LECGTLQPQIKEANSRSSKMEMQKITMSVLGVNQVHRQVNVEIRSNYYTVYYSGGERAERGIEIAEHKNTVRSDCMS
jgi:hypothetical protein